MSAQDGPPKGMETKNVPGPGYVPAPVPNSDHPGHQGTFAGKEGYTNTAGILDPEDAKGDDAKSGAEKSSSSKTTTSKTSGTAAKS